MVTEILREERAIVDSIRVIPGVLIMFPFEPKMTAKRELENKVQLLFKKTEKDLLVNYTESIAKPVIRKLRTVLAKLDFSSYRKSVAVFVSAFIEKIYYLNIPVEERIVIDKSFEVRDIVQNKKDSHQHLVLVISRERSRIFLGSTKRFTRIAYNTPEPVIREINFTKTGSGFSSPSESREISLDKFLHQIDNSLEHILNAYGLPLFVIGANRIIGHFKNITNHLNHIIGFIPGNFEEIAEIHIREKMASYIADWNKVKQKDLLNQLDTALGTKKLSIGIEEVWKQVSHNRGRLLVVEKNYSCSAQHGEKGRIIYRKDKLNMNPLFIEDTVSDIIEKVLENGGDVEMVEEGILKPYQSIALI